MPIIPCTWEVKIGGLLGLSLSNIMKLEGKPSGVQAGKKTMKR